MNISNSSIHLTNVTPPPASNKPAAQYPNKNDRKIDTISDAKRIIPLQQQPMTPSPSKSMDNKELLNMVNNVGGDRTRQSKILVEYKDEIKILNFTNETKNLLARSTISINSNDEDDTDNENDLEHDLNSEALTVKVYILMRKLN